jgi:hypothetical protein
MLLYHYICRYIYLSLHLWLHLLRALGAVVVLIYRSLIILHNLIVDTVKQLVDAVEVLPVALTLHAVFEYSKLINP